jgi:hypothetical protein
MNEIPNDTRSELRRLPGLFRRWEFEQVIQPGRDYRIEDAGSASDGTTLYAIYQAVAPLPETGEPQ